MSRKESEEFKNALKNGHSVVVARDGKLIKINPDRTEEFIRDIGRPIRIKKGTKFRLK